ncbi:bifunctional DNA primase/polymerase [Nocardia sp. NPDC050793]|uniref:bifunctional DNA primase/polymerase n=1 Tax=Nocardia sp. NPDC050793 TaxID=3155159 RepID=UPI0033C04008
MNSVLAEPAAGLVAIALGHARRGFRIFPLHPYSKSPAINQWEQHASCDPFRIRDWWDRWPGNNIAIACMAPRPRRP